jgi:polyphosphate glucokinase
MVQPQEEDDRMDSAQDASRPVGDPTHQPLTLAIDIGGTGLKASVLDAQARMVVPRARIPTPSPCPPDRLMADLIRLVGGLPPADRVSIGFPGVIRHGRVLTAPHFGTENWSGFPLESRMQQALGRPTRLLNDAEIQGLAVIAGAGIEFVATLGTGFGSALFRGGVLAPHLELAHHPVHKDKSYNEYVGVQALEAIGRKRWNKRLRLVLQIVDELILPDAIYLGGGNAREVRGEVPSKVRLVSNDAGLTGGVALWTRSDSALGRDPGAD